MELRRATEEEWRFVYERDFIPAFPPMELRTVDEIENLMRRGKYDFLCLHDGADIVGTVTVYLGRPGWILLDYLCVVASRRNAGLGSQLIKEMLAHCRNNVIITEAEAPEYAPDPPLAARRLEFYRRNGAFLAGFESELFGVRYNIIYWADAPRPDAEIQREYDAICRSIFPPEEYERYVRIPYRAWESASTPIPQEGTN